MVISSFFQFDSLLDLSQKTYCFLLKLNESIPKCEDFKKEIQKAFEKEIQKAFEKVPSQREKKIKTTFSSEW